MVWFISLETGISEQTYGDYVHIMEQNKLTTHDNQINQLIDQS